MSPDVLRDDLLSQPEAGLPADAVIIRPSLWAAVDVVLRLLGSIAGALAPFLIPSLVMLLLFNERVERDPGPAPFAIIDVFELVEFVPGLIVVFLPAVRLAFTRYSFGPDDLRVKRQILEKEEQRVEWSKVTAVRYRRTLFDRLVGIHRMEVIAYGKQGAVMRLVGLRDGARLRDFVARKMRENASVAALFEND